jgi:5,6-dimethylbenzimidazole synthase
LAPRAARAGSACEKGRYQKREIVNFDDAFRAQLHDLLRWRRDVRRFRSEPLPAGTIERLIDMARLAPSVGLSQPWRFVIVDDDARRRAVLDDFTSCNADALKSYAGELAAQYAKLKLAGLEEAPCQVAVFAEVSTDTGHGLGRRTMPEMAEYSVVAAIHTMWLAARAEGIGMGWVSILTPGRIKKVLDVPETWRFLGYFCVGYPETENVTAALERAGWETRQASETFILRR